VVRMLMFCVVGVIVMWIGRALGAAPGSLPWMFVSGGLGAVFAIDVALWWQQRSR
jgi:hypothetical protein